LVGPPDAGAVMDRCMGASMASARVIVHAAVEGGKDADALVLASSPHEASEVDGFIDVGRRFGVEYPLPRAAFGEWPSPSGPQEPVSTERLGVDDPASPETLGVQFASVDESADLYMGDSEPVGGLVDVGLGHADTVDLIR